MCGALLVPIPEIILHDNPNPQPAVLSVVRRWMGRDVHKRCASLLRRAMRFYALANELEPGRVAVHVLNVPPSLDASFKELRRLRRVRSDDAVFEIKIYPGDDGLRVDGTRLHVALPICTRDYRLRCVLLCLLLVLLCVLLLRAPLRHRALHLERERALLHGDLRAEQDALVFRR